MLGNDNESIFISVRNTIRCMLKQELIEKGFSKIGLLIEPTEDKGGIASLMCGLQDDITKTIFTLMGLSISDENIANSYFNKVGSIENYEDIDTITEEIFGILKEYSSMCSVPGRERVTEIATKVIDGLLSDDKETALVYLRDEVELSEEECTFFGIDYKEMISTE